MPGLSLTAQLLQRQSLKDQIKDILIGRIVSGELTPGDRIKEMQVAREFGTSQGPVREAIRCLESLGYVEHKVHFGAVVRIIKRREMEEAFDAREALEVYALGKVLCDARRDVRSIESCLDRMEAAVLKKDITAFSKQDNFFHRRIIELTGNRTLLAMWDSLEMQNLIIDALNETTIPLEAAYKLHIPIVAAIADGQMDKALRRLAEHYNAARRYLT